VLVGRRDTITSIVLLEGRTQVPRPGGAVFVLHGPIAGPERPTMAGSVSGDGMRSVRGALFASPERGGTEDLVDLQ
jgi:hypothetical protein